MRRISTKIKIISLLIIVGFTALSAVGVALALHVPTDYAMDQFIPAHHPLVMNDIEAKKVFHISETTPHIVLLSLNGNRKEHWYDSSNLEKLQKLSDQFSALKGVKSVVSLGNIRSAFDHGKSLVVSNLSELRKQGFDVETILKDPLYTPNLISKDGLHTALFVIPAKITQKEHRRLLDSITALARKAFPDARVQTGGPAAIRTRFIDLLSHEILVFILLSLLCAIIVVKIMFHGYSVLLQMLFILITANAITLGLMGATHISFNILSSTLPIIVTITALGIATHTLVRMADHAHLSAEERWNELKKLMRELTIPHLLTAATTSVGFATLISSRVPMIANYGMVVATGVLIAAVTTLLLLPSIYLWMKWPAPRRFLSHAGHFSYFLSHNARWIVPAIALLVMTFGYLGSHLSWTAKLFDDMPANNSVSRSTDLISRKLGGVTNVDFVIGGKDLIDPWKQPANIATLKKVSEGWRRNSQIGSVITLADFLSTGKNKKTTPAKREGIAELEFLYAMSGDSPLSQFLSSDEKWVRVAVRLPDLPGDKSRIVIEKMRNDLQTQFPKMRVRVSGFAHVLPQINDELSKELMWGFFESLFWIVLLLALTFRSLRWALVAVIPNLVPPVLLLGFLSMFHVPIKPGIAIIFSISLGLAFCNTVYVLERLKQMLKSKTRSKVLPIYELMKHETMPCLVSSLSLIGGFSIFLFSVFPMNKLFGVFMLISIASGLLGDLVWLPTLLKRFPGLLMEGEDMFGFEKISFKKWQNAMRAVQYFILAGLGLVAFHSTYAAENVDSILKAVEQSGAPPSERVDLKMVIGDADGGQKSRELTILRKNGDASRALVRLQKPSDLKGLALLTVAKKNSEEQYLYLPSDKKSRRILGSSKKGKFLDSEISYEDLSISTYKEFYNKVVKDDGKTIQVESRIKPGADSSYGRLVTWISKPDYHVQRIDYYDRGGKILKRAQFKNYQKIGDKFWRAHDVFVENLQDKRSTKMTVLKVSLKKIDDDEISLSALEE